MSAPPPPPASRPREGDDALLLVAGATPEGALLTLQVSGFCVLKKTRRLRTVEKARRV